MFGGPSPEAEHFAITAHQLDPLLGVDPPQRVRTSTEEPNSGVARHIPCLFEVDLTVGEHRVDDVGGDVELGHPGPARCHDVLRVILVGGQSDGAGLDPQRNVLAHQRDSFALGRQIGGAGEDPGVVGLGAEARGQDGGITVVELDVQRTALCPNRNRLIQPAVFESEIIEQP